MQRIRVTMDRNTRHHPSSRVRGLSGLLVGLLVGVVACDSGEARDPEPREGEGRARAQAPEERAETPMAAPAGAGEAEPGAAEARREGAEARAFLEGLEPVKTRAGHLRFTARELEDPQASSIFAARLASADNPPELRLALAEALHRSGGEWSAASLAQLEVEADPEVRAILIRTLAKAPVEAALVGLERGLVDPLPAVRRAAAELAGWAPAAGRDPSVEASLRGALSDDDAGVRAAASRAFGLLGGSARFEAVRPGLADDDAEVRLQSLRALERLDRPRAAALSEVAGLAAEDPDPRVARAAGKLRSEAAAGGS